MSSFIKDWTEKEVDNLTASFRRYRIFVFILKFILPISAITIFVAMLFFAEGKDKTAKITVENISPKHINKDDITSVGVMENPRIQGLDADNQPYSIMAEQAWQENSNLVVMRNITADITTESGSWLSAIAGAGQYFITENVANLQGGVEMFISDEQNAITQIQAQDAQLDIKNSIISSQNPISVKSDMADFAAGGFIANRIEEKITFTGPIKLTIIP